MADERRTSVVVEADGGARGNPGPAGFGAVLKDAETGEVIAEAAESIGHATNNVAEYRGLIAGLELFVEHTPDAMLEVRMDSKLVIEQMAGRWKIKNAGMRPLAITAQSLAPFGTVWTWVPREQNKHADRLANLAMDAAARGEVYDVQAGRAVGAGDTAEATRREDHVIGDNRPGDPTPEAPSPPVNSPLIGWLAGPETTLILLRHGVTDLTVDRRFSGSGGLDPGLNAAGREQAQRAAEALHADGGADVVLTSPLRRTRETAGFVADALGLPLQVEDGFAECAFGEWDGLTLDEVEERWPEEIRLWLGSMDLRPPRGESVVDVQQRVEPALQKILAEHVGQTIVVVSHVTPIKIVVRYCLDMPLPSINRMQLAPASLTTLAFYESGASTLRQFSAIP